MEEPRWTIAQMSEYLGMDNAQVYRAARNAASAKLLINDPTATSSMYTPNRVALLEFLVHGVKYMMVPARGRITRGMPTAHAAPVLAGRIDQGTDPVPVWPTPDGSVRGESFEPLHRCVPIASARDPLFYDVMALVDAIRGGRAREQKIASKLLREILDGKHK